MPDLKTCNLVDVHFTALFCGLLLFKLCRAASAFEVISLLCDVLMCEFISFKIKGDAFSDVHAQSNVTAASDKTKNYLLS